MITEYNPQNNAKTELELDIDRLSYGPYGVGRADGKAIMVANSAPGDRLVARLGDALLVCATETRTQADIETYARALGRLLGRAAAE